MTVQERILALRLLEKAERNPRYAQQIGLDISMRHIRSGNTKERGKGHV